MWNDNGVTLLTDSGGTTSVAQYSVSALTVLAQLLAPLLDITYGSQEKERVITLLTTLMYNVTPYLKNHSLVTIINVIFIICFNYQLTIIIGIVMYV